MVTEWFMDAERWGKKKSGNFGAGSNGKKDIKQMSSKD